MKVLEISEIALIYSLKAMYLLSLTEIHACSKIGASKTVGQVEKFTSNPTVDHER